MKSELVIRDVSGRTHLHLFAYDHDFGLRPARSAADVQAALAWCTEHGVPVVDLRKPALGPPLQPPNEHRTYIVRYRDGAFSTWMTYAQALVHSWNSHPAGSDIMRLERVAECDRWGVSYVNSQYRPDELERERGYRVVKTGRQE